jgi:hypothetical protein
MESKSQKAALAAINEKKKYLIREIKSLQLHGSSSQDVVMDNLKHIGELIKEYGLEERLLTDVVKEIYDALMKHQRYTIAASLAKKYGL